MEGAEKESIISSAIVRLGGLHLLMSYLGYMWSIMKESGTGDLWGSVYTKSSVHHSMSGHAPYHIAYHVLGVHVSHFEQHCNVMITECYLLAAGHDIVAP